MVGHHISPRNSSLLTVVVDWLNEAFPVNSTAAVMEWKSDVSAGRYTVNCPYESAMSANHVAINLAAGGIHSSMASYCLQRLFPCAATRSPDLLLIDFAVNDWMGLADDDVMGFDPSINIERLIREVLLYVPHTALMLTHFSEEIFNAMQSAEHLYRASALHYHVPEVSSRRTFADWLFQASDYPNFRPIFDGLIVPGDRLLSQAWPLPIPTLVRQQCPDMSWSRGLYSDYYHLTHFGHQLLASLVNQQILRYVTNLRISHWTSIADPLFSFTSPQPTTSSSPLPPSILTYPTAPLPPALASALSTSSVAPYQCTLMYFPYSAHAGSLDQASAERYMRVIHNTGFVYQMTGAAKYGMSLSEDGRGRLGQYMTVHFPTPLHSLAVAYVRSGDASMMGNCTAWLSCVEDHLITDPSQSTPIQTLEGVWSERSTHADSTQLWPLLTNHTAPPSPFGPNCDLRYLHLEHVSVGDFRVIGYMWN